MKAMALVTREAGKLGQIEEVNVPEPSEHDVLVRTVSCGICHTDMSAINQDIPVPLPFVVGHEGAGIVEKVGSAVTYVKPGDKVAMGVPYCMECKFCQAGHPMCCVRADELNFGGFHNDGKTRLTDKDGKPLHCMFVQSSYCTLSLTNEINCIKLPEETTMEDLPYVGSLACGLETGSGIVLNYFKAEPGSAFVVFGCGAVGCAAIMAAKIANCRYIIGVDVVDSRLDLALELGATHVINGAKQDAVAEIKKITEYGADYALDNTANPQCILQALDCLAPLGIAVSCGTTGMKTVPVLPQFQLMSGRNALAGVIQGDVRPKDWVPKLVKWYKEGKFPFDRLIKFYDFTTESIEQAYADSHAGTTIKPVVKF